MRETQDLAKIILDLQQENEELKERCERYIWNLGGVSTLLFGYNIDDFNKDYALPALTDANEFAKKYKQLQARLVQAEKIIENLVVGYGAYDYETASKIQEQATQFLNSTDKGGV
jgi:hypothetical protein